MEDLNKVLIADYAKKTRSQSAQRARLLAVVGELVSEDINTMKKGKQNG